MGPTMQCQYFVPFNIMVDGVFLHEPPEEIRGRRAAGFAQFIGFQRTLDHVGNCTLLAHGKAMGEITGLAATH